MGTWGEDAVHSPAEKRGDSEGISPPTHTLTLDLQPPRRWRAGSGVWHPGSAKDTLENLFHTPGEGPPLHGRRKVMYRSSAFPEQSSLWAPDSAADPDLT